MKKDLLGYILIEKSKLTQPNFNNEKNIYHSRILVCITNAGTTRPSIHTVYV